MHLIVHFVNWHNILNHSERTQIQSLAKFNDYICHIFIIFTLHVV